ncbi:MULTISPECIES: hypothetical protein [unclassified Aminobacter]|uniref:hypothetical protein n=1 Tax=unclassified Aminobacter TaxID=2644704 RepID=UPI000467EC4F|nr:MULTISPECIES: hypothetical protein [unclassified Aminobacter]TWH23922.1 hypothetical protein L611_000800000710 [Aminobacter sp. J15]
MIGGATGALLGLVTAHADASFLCAKSRRVELAGARNATKVSGAAKTAVFPVMGWFAGSLFGGE